MSGRLQYRLRVLMHALLAVVLRPRRAVVRLTRRRVDRYAHIQVATTVSTINWQTSTVLRSQASRATH